MPNIRTTPVSRSEAERTGVSRIPVYQINNPYTPGSPHPNDAAGPVGITDSYTFVIKELAARLGSLTLRYWKSILMDGRSPGPGGAQGR